MAVALLGWCSPLAGYAAARQRVTNHLPAAASRARAISRLAPDQTLRLALALPLRNRPELQSFLAAVTQPGHAQYRQYLTPEQFTARFGPTEAEYGTLIAYARANGFRPTVTHSNRTLLEIEGEAARIEKAFGVRLGVYSHPSEARTFYSPDSEPTLELDLPLLEIHGLNNYSKAQPLARRASTGVTGAQAIERAGTGPEGNLLGSDFRKAYVPGSTLTGAGQSVGLFQLEGYFASDITAYLALSKQPAVPLENVLLGGFDGIPTNRQFGSANEEVALDIEMAMSMAPGLDRILVYESSPAATLADINGLLNRMATDNRAKQLSCSWGFDISATSQQVFQQYAAQGQSFFLASGDNGAFHGPVEQPSDDPFITTVGGTVLSLGSTQQRLSESVWSGSGGGISTVYPLPDWQIGISTAANQASPTRRNVPDVAMVAMNVWVTADRGRSFAVQGTSIGAPLWAGYTALINQQAASQGHPPVGFLNPALYQLARTESYSSAFHDITVGNNFTAASPTRFVATKGYDLCTGLGSPAGTNLIQALLSLAPPDSLVVSQPTEVTFLVGNLRETPTPAEHTFFLSASGSDPVSWTVSAPPSWVRLSTNRGTVMPNGTTSPLTVRPNPEATGLLLGTRSTTLWITNLLSGRVEGRTLTLDLGNGGFELGDLTHWELDGDPLAEFADSIDTTFLFGSPSLPGIDDSAFVHRGIYGAYIGEPDRVGSLSQTLPTVAAQLYQISFWLTCPTNGTPNEFHCKWGEDVLFSRVDLDPLPWTRYRYTAAARGPNTVLEFSFLNRPAAFGLDDVQIVAIPTPVLQLQSEPKGTLRWVWEADPALEYRVESRTSLTEGGWIPLETSAPTSAGVLEIPDTSRTETQQFYRVVTVP